MTIGEIRSLYINLDSSTARRAQIEAQLQAAGIQGAIRIPAFDGRGIDLSTLLDCDLPGAERYLGRPLLGAEYGCYRSHLAALDDFLASDAAYGLVFEDDAEINRDLGARIIEAIDRLRVGGVDWDMLHISPGHVKIVTPLDDLGNGHRLLRAHYFPMLATALLWSRAGAQHFVDNYRQVEMPVDMIYREMELYRQRGLAIWPPLARTSGVISDIDGHGPKRKAEGRSWLYGLAKQKRLWRQKLVASWFKVMLY